MDFGISGSGSGSDFKLGSESEEVGVAVTDSVIKGEAEVKD